MCTRIRERLKIEVGVQHTHTLTHSKKFTTYIHIALAPLFP